jgi:tryptophan synthase alpha chain
MKNPIMTHLVCGYPSIKESQELLKILSKHSKYIEIQIPFSDPIADGPIISNANEVALEN